MPLPAYRPIPSPPRPLRPTASPVPSPKIHGILPGPQAPTGVVAGGNSAPGDLQFFGPPAGSRRGGPAGRSDPHPPAGVPEVRELPGPVADRLADRLAPEVGGSDPGRRVEVVAVDLPRHPPPVPLDVDHELPLHELRQTRRLAQHVVPRTGGRKGLERQPEAR